MRWLTLAIAAILGLAPGAPKPDRHVVPYDESYLPLHPQLETVKFWLGGIGSPPDYVLHPDKPIVYFCIRERYITPTGTPTGPGTDATNGFNTFANLKSHIPGGYGAGDCADLLAGHSYSDNVVLSAGEGGNNNTPYGFAVFRSVDAFGNLVRAAPGNLTLNSGAAHVVNAHADGTPIFGTDSNSIAPSYFIVDGVEMSGQPGSTSFESCMNTNGPGTWSQPNMFGPTHWVAMYTYAHDCNGGALVTTNGDFMWFWYNVIGNSSCCSPFGASAISIGTPKHRRDVPLTGYDAMMPYKNIVYGNYIYNAVEYAISRNSPDLHTDGEAITLDDFANQQGHGSGSGQNNAGLYQFTTLLAANVGFNNGGNCIQINSAYRVTTTNNTCYVNNVDLAQVNADKVEILVGGGDYNFTYNNAVYTAGPWSQVFTSLTGDSSSLHVNDVRAVSEFIRNNGSFSFTVLSPSVSDTIKVFINGTAYLATGYTADGTNVCNPAVNPGCVSGIVTFSTNVLQADGQQFNQFNVQTVTNGNGDCTGPSGPAVGDSCNFQGYVFPVQSVPFRGTTIVTCSGFSTGCDEVTWDATNPHSVLGNNVVKNTNGGGSFFGLNASTPLSATGFGDRSTVLGNNLIADFIPNNPLYVTTDAAAPGDTNGPGWLAVVTGVTPPPNLQLLAAISPAVGYAAVIPASVPGGNLPAYCPGTDILGNATNCFTTAFNAGAFDNQAAPLAFTGVGDVPGVPPALGYYGTVAYTKAGASGRLPALQINCNGDPTTSYVINISTAAVLNDTTIDDGSGGGTCPGWKKNVALGTATIATTNMTVSACSVCTFTPGQIVTGASVTNLSIILSQTSGTPGGIGVYALSQSSTVAVGETVMAANSAFTSRAMDQALGNRECDFVQATPANQPMLLYNNVSNKDVLQFSGSQWLQLNIVNLDPFCGQMFGTPSLLMVAERTFGTSTQVVFGNVGSGRTEAGFGGSNLGYYQAGGVVLNPAQIDGTYSAQITAGYATVGSGPPTEPGFDQLNASVTNGTFSPNGWDTAIAWGAEPGGTNGFTGFSPIIAYFGIPENPLTLQVLPVALTAPQAASEYTLSLKPNFGLP